MSGASCSESSNTGAISGTRGIPPTWGAASTEYNGVYVLAFYWDDGHQSVAEFLKEAMDLTHYMEHELRYVTKLAKIQPRSGPGASAQQLVEREIGEFVHKYGRDSRNLLIIHYGGHGIEDKDDRLRWAPTSVENGSEEQCVVWTDIQTKYFASDEFDCVAEVLLLLDCCNASLAARNQDNFTSRRMELLAACAAGLATPVPSYSWTFTKRFLDALRDRIDRDGRVDIRTIHSFLCKIDGGLQQTPILVDFAGPSLPSISLCRLSQNSSASTSKLDITTGEQFDISDEWQSDGTPQRFSDRRNKPKKAWRDLVKRTIFRFARRSEGDKSI